MAQGIPWDQDQVIEALRPYFQKGYSINKACKLTGVPQSTVMTWIEQQRELRLKIEAWQNEVNDLARTNWIEKIKAKDYNASKDWLDRKEKGEFSTKSIVEHENPSVVVLNSEDKEKFNKFFRNRPITE